MPTTRWFTPPLAAALGVALALPLLMAAGPAEAARAADAASAAVPTAGAHNTPGWSMMNRYERQEHRRALLGFRERERCEAYLLHHREQMSARARARGQSLAAPDVSACAHLPAPASARAP
jgi:acyl-CoA reductase-like NAD-dependent aldehyde dehydrogenase